jgi:hypothetical protein
LLLLGIPPFGPFMNPTRLRLFAPVWHRLAFIAWMGGLGIGFVWLMTYAFTPGPNASAPSAWPADAIVKLDSTRPTLIFLAHPHCPCMQSSLDVLEQIVTRCRSQVAVHVLFYRPSSFPEGWEKTRIWSRAQEIPGVQIYRDDDGKQARVFGAYTSGQVLLYDARGQLLFRGGLTESRGHGGASAGLDLVVALIQDAPIERRETPVFGCPLRSCPTCDNTGDEPCPK